VKLLILPDSRADLRPSITGRTVRLFRSTPRATNRNTALFLLNRFQVPRGSVQPHFAPVLVRFDFVENWAPNWHFPVTVGDRSIGFSIDDSLHALERKLSAISLRNQSQV
jgi:hypothetical protein